MASPSPRRSSLRRSAFALFAVAFSLSLGTFPAGCANQIGLDGVEYDRKDCTFDVECASPLKCRYVQNEPFLCDVVPPSATKKFGEPVAPGADGGCESNAARDGFCTHPCKSNADCLGPNIPRCANFPLPNDPSRFVALCSK